MGCACIGFKARSVPRQSTPAGLKAIETIQVGDWVLAKSETSGEVSAKRVEHLIHNKNSTILRVTLAGVIHTETIGVTADHPFRSINNTWVKAGELKPGDELQDLNGRVLRVQSVVGQSVKEDTYNFSVEIDHTYAVGLNQAWVHNSDICTNGGGAGKPITPPSATKFVTFDSPTAAAASRLGFDASDVVINGNNANISIVYTSRVTPSDITLVSNSLLAQGATSLTINTGPIINVSIAVRLENAAQNGATFLGFVVTKTGDPNNMYILIKKFK